MTAVLGSTACPFLGCSRARYRSPSGIHYGFCLSHTLDRLAILGTQQGRETVGRSRALGFASLPVAVQAHRPAA